jgi:tetratricopeptide (TPR) repeat protein
MSRLVLSALLATALLNAQTITAWQHWIDAGATAFSAGNYGDAATAFQNAACVDANDPSTKLFLGAAHMSAWMKDKGSNRESAFQAEEQLRRVIILQPGNEQALLWLASLHLQQQRFDEAELAYGKAAALARSEKATADAHYVAGMLLWNRWFAHYSDARSKLGIAASDSGLLPDEAFRTELRTRYGPLINDAISQLRAVRPGTRLDAKAAAYLSLLYRERAVISDDRSEYVVNLRMAEDLEEEGGPEAAELRSRIETTPQLIPPTLPALTFRTSSAAER